ncbi:tRNA (adenine(58)-N(1))-methyltransferase catalytic subunit TRMT61A [Diprion similis]|uniref:tRNA (adenine(58)-N(1))-methyltransferase catalytic subunit TRMT61A n=1 Tax=Diprion similis TaxID=362088 RepID=UPI001EF7BE3A|nr:tRNA (adenine(58)-N(1))-methyltransferase catalytic subunit TRMT61A [Diprion similis]
MSFNGSKDLVEEGDVVILYIAPSNMHSLEVTPKTMNKKGVLVENVFQTVYGALKVASLVGAKYGAKVDLSRGWAYVLQPTSDLWTLTLPHRTQIIYTPDISNIVYLMELEPGKTVIETGTGSGSLSHALINAIKPHGHLYTFDFHEQRVSVADMEFKKHGLGSYVTVEQRDVCQTGFGDALEGKADAIFLDLPHPWLTIEHARRCFRKSGGRLCSFSPCIEQVQRTCENLESAGFIEIKTIECLQRELTVQYKTLPVLKLECLKSKHTDDNKNQNNGKEVGGQERLVTVSHAHSLPGHTGYITIATLPPIGRMNC